MFSLYYFYNLSLLKNNIGGDPIPHSSSLPTFINSKCVRSILPAFFMEAVNENLTQSETIIKRLVNARSLTIEFP